MKTILVKEVQYPKKAILYKGDNKTKKNGEGVVSTI